VPGWEPRRTGERSARCSFRCTGRRRLRRFALGGVEGLGSAGVSAIADLQGVTTGDDWNLDRLVQFEQPDTLTVEHDVVRAAADLQSDCFVHQPERCRHCRSPSLASERHLLWVSQSIVRPAASKLAEAAPPTLSRGALLHWLNAIDDAGYGGAERARAPAFGSWTDYPSSRLKILLQRGKPASPTIASARDPPGGSRLPRRQSNRGHRVASGAHDLRPRPAADLALGRGSPTPPRDSRSAGRTGSSPISLPVPVSRRGAPQSSSDSPSFPWAPGSLSTSTHIHGAAKASNLPA
jgi:hypothetical protein